MSHHMMSSNMFALTWLRLNALDNINMIITEKCNIKNIVSSNISRNSSGSRSGPFTTT